MAGGIAERVTGRELAAYPEGIPDEDLLAQFLEAKGPESEDAFRVLVGRHGPRVLGICRHILEREHDAEDAFQATFLALARNAASIRDPRALGGWIQEVAYRTALKTRARRSRRRTLERQVMAMPRPRDEPDDQSEWASLAELRPVLHEEVVGLPDKYRIPVVLSYLEGKTNEEVAALLQWPVGTVKGRLSRGRALLRSRLTRRGVALSAGTLLIALSRSRAAAADVPAELLEGAASLAFRSGSGAVPPDLPLPTARPTTDAGPPRGSAPSSDEPGGVEFTGPGFRRGLEKVASRSGPGWLAAAALLLLTFSAAIFLGGIVSAATYGGRFPDLRSAISGLMPSWGGGSAAHCQR